MDRGLRLLPKEGALHYAKGLSLIRQKQLAQGMQALKQAIELSPADWHFAYTYAVGLYSQGDKKAAFAFLKQRLESHASERNNLYLLAQLAIQENRQNVIKPFLPRLSQLALVDWKAGQLMELLKARSMR